MVQGSRFQVHSWSNKLVLCNTLAIRGKSVGSGFKVHRSGLKEGLFNQPWTLNLELWTCFSEMLLFAKVLQNLESAIPSTVNREPGTLNHAEICFPPTDGIQSPAGMATQGGNGPRGFESRQFGSQSGKPGNLYGWPLQDSERQGISQIEFPTCVGPRPGSFMR